MSLFALASQGCSHAIAPAPGLDPGSTAASTHEPAPNGAATAKVTDLYRVPVEGLPQIGDPDAPVTLIEFTDYQCPFCQRAEQTVGRLRATYGDALRVVVAERPLPAHDRARPAALAALAADAQGKFETMHAGLFALAGNLTEASIVSTARQSGLDLAHFEVDRNAAPLAPSEQLAERMGVTGTPTFFVNGRRIVGAQPYETFRDVVEERLTAARALLASGVRPRDVYAGLIANGIDHAAGEAKEQGAACANENCNGGPDDSPGGDAVESVPIDGAPARGPSGASITIVSFGDFECPYSAKAEATLRAIESAHPGDVRVVFKNMPLPIHLQARLAALAALAADAQGHFWDFHDRVFSRAGAPIDRAALDKIAAELGLDMARFSRDIDDESIAAHLARDEADARTLAVRGTPTFFVNGHRLVGAQPESAFEAAITKPR